MKNFKIHIYSISLSLTMHIVMALLNINNDVETSKINLSNKMSIQIRKEIIKKVGTKTSSRVHTIAKMAQDQKLLSFLKKVTQSTITDLNTSTISYLNYSRSLKQIIPHITSPLKHTSKFGLNLVPPKGVSFSELNSMEKVLHGFNVRVYKTFVNSFFKSLDSLKSQYPDLEKELLTARYNLKGRMVFDQNGNIVSIKIIKSTVNNHIHELYEKTLTGIYKIPNPPKIIINQNDEFVIYFRLNIN